MKTCGATVVLTSRGVEIRMRGGSTTIVSVEDAELVGGVCWHTNGRGYAIGVIDGRRVYLHRLIAGAKPGQHVDHANRDRMDNRRPNLRVATPGQNAANQRKRTGATSRFKGVSWSAKERRWLASITVDYRHIRLGVFAVEAAAARAYDAAAMERFGAFALTNHRLGLLDTEAAA